MLDYYRKPLAHYGEVLECFKGKPVGSLTVTNSGLTCDTQKGNNAQVNGPGDSTDHELRAGSPLRYRIVSVSDAAGWQDASSAWSILSCRKIRTRRISVAERGACTIPYAILRNVRL